jgi:NADH dehydrogenase
LHAFPVHRIVIVGGGAGGLYLAGALGETLGRNAAADVLLIDDRLTHVWKPLLHEMAAGTLPPQESEVSFLQQARRHHFRFHPGDMESVDRTQRQVWLKPLIDERGGEVAPRRAIGYDTLVVAIGSMVNDFGTRGVREHAIALDDAHEARRFHRLMLAACGRAELQGAGPVQLAIVGGGATGVELAAELTEAIADLASYGLRLRQMERPVQVRVIEAGPRLLPGLPDVVAAKVTRDLDQLGVDVLLNQKVTEVGREHVSLAEGQRLPASLTVWAAGIRGRPVLRCLDGLELDKAGRLLLRPTLQTTLDDDVFALGDCATCAAAPDGRPAPATAQAAQQQARLLARSLPRRLRGSPLQHFRYRDRGALVAVGRRRAVASLVGLLSGQRYTLEGTLARLSYEAVHRKHLVQLHGLLRTAVLVVAGWLAGRTQPRTKLH